MAGRRPQDPGGDLPFGRMSAAEVDALDGHMREAWYAWRNGKVEAARAIIATYERRDGEPANREPANREPANREPAEDEPAG